MSTHTSKLDRSRLYEAGFVVGKYLLLTFFLLIIVPPFMYVLSVSLRTPAEIYQITLIPETITFQNYIDVFDEFSGPLLDSLFIASGTALLSMAITIPSAYAIGRKQFPGRQAAFYVIILALLFPHILLIIPISDIWNGIGLYNTIPGLWLAYQPFVTPFSLWILRDFFENLPKNLEEAAQVYGCTEFSAFIRVILPLSAPAVVAVGFLAFLAGWNDFLFANFLTTGTGPEPATVELFKNVGGELKFWETLMAQALVIGIPPAVLYMIGRKYLAKAFAVN
ncbi:MAG: carbohydrate ABC transporter permease [Natronomonas sp.]|jgi:ABC-type glycerol-3-phosphate transport system permease component|uniref:carbohydrate ABC transporter permease n=1 Tax=Natronomonas sp. TaxID=2184060 RepID=UPI002870251B|nr:carbohydrate ABC transporter permease [Natronomonas sp.]MDR9431866.1 carbohydrate ABC transporter permease [Natronomonas sp.]